MSRRGRSTPMTSSVGLPRGARQGGGSASPPLSEHQLRRPYPALGWNRRMRSGELRARVSAEGMSEREPPPSPPTVHGSRMLERAQVRQNCSILSGCWRKVAVVGALAALVAKARPRTARNPTRSSLSLSAILASGSTTSGVTISPRTAAAARRTATFPEPSNAASVGTALGDLRWPSIAFASLTSPTGREFFDFRGA
jgi:hypothetical protein